jgi:hypothetical protein
VEEHAESTRALETDEVIGLGVEPDDGLMGDPNRNPWPLALYLILYPQELEERIVETLEAAGVPGYTEFPKLIGRGRRIRHFDNQIWPGATGAVFTVIGPDLVSALVPPFEALNRQMEERSRGIHGLHMFAIPCRQVI